MKNLLYIHGYNGSPEGNSCSLFRRFMPSEGWNVIGMDYCQDDCNIALEQIKDTVITRSINIVVGSSLGGYLTLLTTGIERIAINPCYCPSIELPKLGPWNGLPSPTIEMISSYEAYEHCLKEFSEGEKALITGYFAMEDELLGDRYQEEFQKDIGKVNLIPGGHHLSENAAKEICKRFRKESRKLF